MHSIHLFVNRHRLATLIASGALLLAAAAPVAAHHPNADGPGREAFFSNTVDTAAEEVDGWQGGEFDTSTEANTKDGSSAKTTASDQADEANDGDSGDAEDVSDDDSTTGADFKHAGTSDHGRPHRAGGSDDMSGGQGSTSNG